jgi:DUF1680 family protein
VLTQTTEYPRLDESTMHLKMDKPARFVVALRVPAWAGAKSLVRVNGKSAGVPFEPGRWAELDRTWRDGDRIELTLDMPLRLVPIDPGHPDIVALVRGPVALFSIEPGTAKMTKTQMLAAQRVSVGSGDWVVTADSGKVVMRAFPAIKDERYRLYQQT